MPIRSFFSLILAHALTSFRQNGVPLSGRGFPLIGQDLNRTFPKFANVSKKPDPKSKSVRMNLPRESVRSSVAIRDSAPVQVGSRKSGRRNGSRKG